MSSPQPWAPRVHSTKTEYLLLSYNPEIWQLLPTSPDLNDGSPLPRPQFQPFPTWFLFFSSLDPSARDYFTTKLWSNPGQHQVAHVSKQCCKQCHIQYQNNIEHQLWTEHKALTRLITPYYTWGQYYIESFFRKIEIFLFS